MQKPSAQRALLVTSLGAAGLLSAYLYWVLGFDGFRSDVQMYWNDSLRWFVPFNRDHVPLYPMLIALLRGGTLNLLPPFLLMWLVVVAAKTLGLICVYRGVSKGGNERAAIAAAVAFLVWPMVGTVYAVYPVADVLAMLFVVAGVCSLRHGRNYVAAASLAAALVTHKAVWPVVAAIAAIELLGALRGRRSVTPLFLPLVLAPLVLLVVGGWWYHGSPLWILERSIDLASLKQGSPAIIRSIEVHSTGWDWVSLLRKAMIWGTVGLTLALLASGASSRERLTNSSLIGIPVGLLLLFVVTNEKTLWAVVRFSPLLALNVGFLLTDAWDRLSRVSRALGVSLAVVSFASQFAFAWYLAVRYFG
jgi:hypothetical protein